MTAKSRRLSTMRPFHAALVAASVLGGALLATACSEDTTDRAVQAGAAGPAAALNPRPWRTDNRPDIGEALTSKRVAKCVEFRYLDEDKDPPTYLVECLETGDTFHVVPASGEVTSTLVFSLPAPRSSASTVANPDDMRQARSFVAELPPACGNSRISVASDGTVIVHLSCSGNGQSMRGEVRIKDGIITHIR